MLNSENLDIMDDIMNALLQTDTYFKMVKSYPRVAEAEQRIESQIERMGLSRGDSEALSSAAFELASAYEELGIIYGMRVATSVKHVCENPTEYGALVLARVEKGKSA